MKTKPNRISIRSIALLMALVLVIGIAFVVPTQAAADTGNVGKLVDFFQSNNYTFTLNTNSRFFLATEPTGQLLQTVQLVQRQFAADGRPSSTPMDIVWGDTKMLRSGDIFIQIAEDSDIGADGYKIEIGANNYATVTAEDTRGLLYGLNMLQKHFRNGDSNSIKGFTTYDTPDTKERTVQLDCARKYLTVEYVCNFIKEASWMGYNTLQLHVSEDGGFRADFWDPAYYVDGHYQPENDLSWICGSHPQSWCLNETDVGLPDYSNDYDRNKYLTTAELIQIINTCKEYQINVIPSFDSPAHMDYLNWKFEQNYKSNNAYSFVFNGQTFMASATSGCINYSGTTNGATPTWPYYTCMDIRDNTTRGQMSQAFVKTIYKDMADFFKYYAGSEYFVIGADEPNLYNDSIKNTAWRYSLLPGYINEIDNILTAKGYTCRIFNDFMNANAVSQLNDGIQILFWNTPFNSISGVDNNYKVTYINDSGTKVSDPMTTVAQYVSDGRTVFNCVNLHTYYVLRVAPNGKGGAGGGLNPSNGDARSTKCYQWEFYAADEVGIYNKWTPNNIRKDGLYREDDRIVPDAQFGGAYFLTWHDYASVSTETAMWNGVQDTVNNSGETYSVRNRMWSNITKMWNWDVSNTLSYNDFANIRSTLGDFPGLKSDTYSGARYATATTLPTGTAPIQLADHTALTAAVAKKLAKGSYTDETYAAYEEAFNWAVYTNNRNDATAEELGDALASLEAAKAALVIQTNVITVIRKTNINGSTHVLGTDKYAVPVGEGSFNLFIPTLNGYKFLRVEGANFTVSEAGDGSGYLSGTISGSIEITLWYENQVDVSRLNNLLADAITEQGDYTTTSWRAYTNALAAAQAFDLTPDTQQSTVLSLVKALEDARTALVVNSETTFVKAEAVAGSFNQNGQVGLHIYTSSNVPTLVITKDGTIVNPDSITGQVQTLTNGDVVKYWLVFLPANEAGAFTYAITYGAYSAEVTVTVA